MFTLKKLILEAEDDFNVTPGGEWNVETLSVGDEITPDMFQTDVMFWSKGFNKWKIIKINFDSDFD